MAGCVQNKSDDAAFFDSLKGSIDGASAINCWRPVPNPVPTENLIRTVRVTDRADVGPANDGNVSIADVHSVNVDEWLASFGRSSGRRVGVHGLPAATVHGGRQAA